MLCPSCVGGETSDFGGILIDPCQSEARPLTPEERESAALLGLEAALDLPLYTALRWTLPSAAEPEVVRDAEVAIHVSVDSESAGYLERSPRDSSEAAPSECPDQIPVNATVQLTVDDASLSAELSASVAVVASGGLWQLFGVHDLAGVRGELDLNLDPGQPYEGLLQLEETGGESGRCGSLRLATRLREEGVWVTRAEGTWRAGSCTN